MKKKTYYSKKDSGGNSSHATHRVSNFQERNPNRKEDYAKVNGGVFRLFQTPHRR